VKNKGAADFINLPAYLPRDAIEGQLEVQSGD
jgi:hypothetical protein